MKCPSCKKADIREEKTLDGRIFNRQKVITFYCPLCDYKSVKRFKIKEEEFQALLEKER